MLSGFVGYPEIQAVSRGHGVEGMPKDDESGANCDRAQEEFLTVLKAFGVGQRGSAASRTKYYTRMLVSTSAVSSGKLVLKACLPRTASKSGRAE